MQSCIEEIKLDLKEVKKMHTSNVNYTDAVTFEVVSAVVLPQLLFLAFVLSLTKKRLLFDKQCAALDAR